MNLWLASLRQLVLPAALLSLLWWLLAGAGHWRFGIPAALVAVLLSRWLAPARPAPVAWAGLWRFLLYFLCRSLLGGLDVAWRALHPRLPLQPVIRDYPLDLPQAQARALFVATLSLLPGTLACDLRGNRLRVHSIAGDPTTELALLRRHVLALYPPAVGESR